MFQRNEEQNKNWLFTDQLHTDLLSAYSDHSNVAYSTICLGAGELTDNLTGVFISTESQC